MDPLSVEFPELIQLAHGESLPLYLVPVFSCFVSYYRRGRGTVYHYYLPVALTLTRVRNG